MDFSTLDALLELLIHSPFMPPLKDEITDHLVICKAILKDPPLMFGQDGTLEELKSMVKDVGSIFFSFHLKKMNEYMALELCMQIRELIDDRKSFNWICKAKRIYEETPHPSRLFYPKTSPHVFINNLLEDLEEFVKDTSSLTLPFNHLIVRIQRPIEFWNSHLVEISSDPPNGLRDIIDNIINMAYEVEYAVDSFLVGDFPSWHCIFWLVDTLKKFDQIKSEGKDDEDEDLEAKKPLISNMLFKEDEQLNVISITGRSGIGKSAFAKELYNSPRVIEYFKTRAWCRVNGLPSLRNSLVDLVYQLVDPSDRTRWLNDEELCEQLYKCLEERRFLVVIDGMDDLVRWVYLRRCFPDSRNGSRIIFTSTMSELDFLDKLKCISPLDDKIWEMRMKSLFSKESFHPKLLKVGMKIAKRCKLHSVPWVAGLVNTTEKTVNMWEEIAKTLGSRILGDATSQEMRLLELSYMYLPDHLRLCFLYVRACLYGGKILVSKLIRLWIAEGFIRYNAFQSFEDTAEDYFADLMARNLLIPSKEGSNGKVRYCVLDDLVLGFVSKKVVEDNFLEFVDGIYEDDIGYGIDPNVTYCPTPMIYHIHRLRITNTNHIFLLKPSGPFVKSLLFSSRLIDIMFRRCYDISFIFENFKFLRILDFEDTNIGDSFIDVDVLVLLRYLAFQGSMDYIPPSIANLWNLETFIFKGYEECWTSKVVRVSDSIWNMSKLRHFHITNGASFDFEPHQLEKYSSILDNLQTFSTPYLAYGDDMEKMLRRLKIRKLKCVFVDSWDDTKNCNKFPVLDFLNQLVSLKVFYKGNGKYPCQFNLPSNLKKITLSFFRMPWNEISQLAMLHNLKILKLISNPFEGERWDIKDDVVFIKLKYLKLSYLNIVEWSATCDHFPYLECLILDNCKRLKEIPLDFAYINTIQRIEVKRCNLSAAKSATLIQEKHIKYLGNDERKIKVYLESNIDILF